MKDIKQNKSNSKKLHSKMQMPFNAFRFRKAKQEMALLKDVKASASAKRKGN